MSACGGHRARRRVVDPPFADANLGRRDERDYFHAEGRRLKATLRALPG
jgi:hypothetical protein